MENIRCELPTTSPPAPGRWKTSGVESRNTQHRRSRPGWKTSGTECRRSPPTLADGKHPVSSVETHNVVVRGSGWKTSGPGYRPSVRSRPADGKHLVSGEPSSDPVPANCSDQDETGCHCHVLIPLIDQTRQSAPEPPSQRRSCWQYSKNKPKVKHKLLIINDLGT